MSDFKYTRKYFETEMEKGMTDYQKKEFHRIKRREFLKHAGMGAVGMLLAIKTIPFEHIGSYALKSFTGETEEHEQREFYLKRPIMTSGNRQVSMKKPFLLCLLDLQADTFGLTKPQNNHYLGRTVS